MKNMTLVLALVLFLLVAGFPGAAVFAADDDSEKCHGDDDDDDNDDDEDDDDPTHVLILFNQYDGPWNYGPLYANMAGNLLSGLECTYALMEAGSYLSGDMIEFDAVLYLGTIYDHPASPELLQDIADKVRPVFWINYNLWGIAWNPAYAVDWGFNYLGVTVQSDYFNVEYKGEFFDRHELYQEYNRVEIVDPDRAAVKSWLVSQSNPDDKVPHIVAGDGLWYAVENPLTWLTDGNRYLVFADLLAEFLGVEATQGLRVMVRIEDIAPGIADVKALDKITKKLKKKKIPFSVGVIPVFVDPTGEYFGSPVEIPLSDDRKLVKLLKKIQKRGGTILLHGYTHQYDRTTGDDWEFWIEETNVPVPEDSEDWVQKRIDRALEECHDNGLYPYVWETPHYSASQLDYDVFYRNFDFGYERTRIFNNFDSNSHLVIYGKMMAGKGAQSSDVLAPVIYGEDGQLLSIEEIRAREFQAAGAQGGGGMFNAKASGDEDVYILQYVPYPVYESTYGNVWIPENLGYLEPGVTFPETLEALAKKMAVMKNPVASFFYHHDYPKDMLFDTIKKMEALGYDFVSVEDLLDSM